MLTIYTRITPLTPVRDTFLAAMQTASGDPTVAVNPTPLNSGYAWEVTTAAGLTDPQRTAVQAAIDAAISETPQQAAQRAFDHWPNELRALALALIDQLNVIRAALVPPKIAITPAQALQAVRDKAATL